MQLTLCKHSALAALRSLRSAGTSPAVAFRQPAVSSFSTADAASTTGQTSSSRSISAVRSSRTDILSPNPYPRQRWTRSLIDGIDFSATFTLSGKTVNFAVPSKASRIRVRNSTSTVYEKGIPKGAFIKTRYSSEDCTLVISSPELLFVELAKEMHPVEHLMLGHELCGTFSRDAEDPYNGPITYGIQPATSTERIRRFLNEAKSIRGIEAARTSAQYLNDNAWSPTESLVAALLRLPIDSLGYDFGELMLNPRFYPNASLPGSADSRVPDIMIAGTPVGINYDGAVHLDLDSIADAAREVGSNPQLQQAQAELSKAMRNVRSKVVDDIRRNRELAADGLAVFPVLKEDLYTKGGFDRIVEYLITVIEQLTDRDMSDQKRILRMTKLADARWHMALSLLPGKHERSIHVNRFICSNEVTEGQCEVHECWIEL